MIDITRMKWLPAVWFIVWTATFVGGSLWLVGRWPEIALPLGPFGFMVYLVVLLYVRLLIGLKIEDGT